MDKRYDKFTSLIINIYRCIQKIKNFEIDNLGLEGLKGYHVHCIFYLYNSEDGLSPKELRELCDEDKGAISRSIKELETLGYVEYNNVEKKYKTPIKLTKKGKELGEFISSRINDYIFNSDLILKESEREKFYNQLTFISNGLSKICKTYGDNNG